MICSCAHVSLIKAVLFGVGYKRMFKNYKDLFSEYKLNDKSLALTGLEINN